MELFEVNIVEELLDQGLGIGVNVFALAILLGVLVFDAATGLRVRRVRVVQLLGLLDDFFQILGIRLIVDFAGVDADKVQDVLRLGLDVGDVG